MRFKEFAQNIISFWAQTWKESKVLFLAEMVGTLGGMIGAGVLCFMAPNPNLLVSFSAYLISAFALLYSCYVRQSSWMMILMAYYAVITSIGLIRLF